MRRLLCLLLLVLAGHALALDCSSGGQWVKASGGTQVELTAEALCAALDTANGGYGHSLAGGSSSVCVIPYPDYPDSFFPLLNACAFTGGASGSTGGSISELTPEKIADMTTLWLAFMGAAVVVLCAKAVYSRFKVNYEG